MRRPITIGIALLSTSLLAACHANHSYNPSASPTNLAAYAATAKFPANAQPMENPRVAAVVNSQNSQITIRNFGAGVLSNFNLWVNQSYVLHVDRIDANGLRVFDPSLFYNSAGNSLSGTSPAEIKKVQIVTPNNDVMNVQGPQLSE